MEGNREPRKKTPPRHQLQRDRENLRRNDGDDGRIYSICELLELGWTI